MMPDTREPMNDDDAIVACRSGDHERFGILVRRYEKELMGHALTLLGNHGRGNRQDGMAMKENNDSVSTFVPGQKVAFAAASLVMGIVSCIHMLGAEKGILAVVFGWLAKG